MKRIDYSGDIQRGRGVRWFLVWAVATAVTILIPCPAVAQLRAGGDLADSEWRTALHPQLPPQRIRLTPAQRDGVRWGARIGGFVGLATGVILSARRDCEEEECLLAPVAAVVSVSFGIALGTVAGMGIGLVVGSINDGSRESQLRLGLSVGAGN